MIIAASEAGSGVAESESAGGEERRGRLERVCVEERRREVQRQW